MPHTQPGRRLSRQCARSQFSKLAGGVARLRGLVEHGQAEGAAGQARVAGADAGGRHHLRAVEHLAGGPLLQPLRLTASRPHIR